MRYIQTNNRGLLEKILTLTGGAILLVIGLMFSAVLFVLIIVVGLLAWGYFWWKTRELRRVMRERSPGGEVIEGEVIIVEDGKDDGQNVS